MTYSIFDKPIKVYGVPNFEKTGRLERLPQELRVKLLDRQRLYGGNMDIEHLGRRTAGARAAFRTNSRNIKITMRLETLAPDPGMSRFACSSACVYFGRGESWRFAGLVSPESYMSKVAVRSFEKDEKLEDVMIFLPRNEIVEDITVEIDDCAEFFEPTPYRYEKPMVFFGSSITEGGHASIVTNAYTALLSRWLDADYYNLGFSGSCRGQIEFGEYICSLEPSVLIYDYDHNAPTAKELAATHEPFFEYVRGRMPQLPVLMMSAPNWENMPEADARRDIIRRTYENAAAKGDKNVRFIDGREFFGKDERQVCTTDTVHPNDFGFHRMAETIFPVLKELLEKTR